MSMFEYLKEIRVASNPRVRQRRTLSLGLRATKLTKLTRYFIILSHDKIIRQSEALAYISISYAVIT